MKRRKRNKALLSIFLSALLMLSGAFQALASAEDLGVKPTPEATDVQLVEEETVLQSDVEVPSEEVAPVDSDLGQEEVTTDGSLEIENEVVDALAVLPSDDSQDAPVSDPVPATGKNVLAAEAPKTNLIEGEKLPVDAAALVTDDEAQDSEEMLEEKSKIATMSLEELNLDKGLKKIDFKSGWCYDWKNLKLNHDFGCNLDFNWGEFSKFNIMKILPGSTKKLSFKKEWHGDANIYKFVVMELSVKDVKESKVVAYFPLLRSSGWEFEFMAPKGYHNGSKYNEFQYSVKEVPIHGYETDVIKNGDNFIIHNYQLGKVHVKKEWDDNENESKSRPDEVSITLKGGDEDKQYVLNPANNWEHTFILPMFNKENDKIEYTVEEVDVPGYTVAYTSSEEAKAKICPVLHPKIEATNLLITNTYNDENDDKVTIKGEKTWNDIFNRPSRISVMLYRNGFYYKSQEVRADDNGDWKYEFKDLDKYDRRNQTYEYTVKEKEMMAYKSTVKGNDICNYQYRGTLYIKKMNKSCAPLPGAVFRILDLQGKVLHEDITTGGDGTVRVDLPVGKYKIQETKAPVGYKLDNRKRTIIIFKNMTLSLNVSNEKVDNYEIEVIKEWVGDELAKRPTSIDYQILRNGVLLDKTYTLNADTWTDIIQLPMYDEYGKLITYSIKEKEVSGYTSTYTLNGENLKKRCCPNPGVEKHLDFKIINTLKTVVPEMTTIDGKKIWQDGDGEGRPRNITINLMNGTEKVKSVVVEPNNEGKWLYSFKDVPVFDTSGTRIEYSISEDVVEGYEPISKGEYDLLNVRMITISGEKTWLDSEEDRRPETIKVHLMNGTKTIESVDVEPNDDDQWLYTFKAVPLFGEDNEKIKYTISENSIPDYKLIPGEGYNILNIKTINITGEKTWDEYDESYRPESIVVKLNRVVENGNPARVMGVKSVQIESDPFTQKVTPNADGDWLYEFKDLEKYDSHGNAYTYTVEEEAVPGYNPNPIIKGYNITNLQKRRTLIVQKINTEQAPISGAVFSIISEDEKIKTTLSSDSTGIYSILLPLGKYTLQEITAPSGYQLNTNPVEVNLIEGQDPVTITVINTRTPGGGGTTPSTSGTLVVKKVDVDKQPLAGAVFDILNQAGSIIRTGLTTGEDGTISAVLPLGVYSIRETKAPTGFQLLTADISVTLNIDGQTVNQEVINTRFPIPVTGGKIAIKGEKTWEDLMNRPEMITVKLLRNGEEYKELDVKASDDGKWMYEFKDLDEADAAGVAYKYTVEEVKIAGYDVKVDGFNLINYQKRGTLMLNKVDKDKVGLPGAVFSIYTLEGKLIDTLTTGADGTLSIILPLGLYRIAEITAPKGYDKKEISNLLTLMKDGDVFTMEVINEKTKSGPGILPSTGGGTSSGGGTYTPTLPKTGSSAQPILYIFGLFALIVGSGELRRKPKRS